jgi:hypothetical protein
MNIRRSSVFPGLITAASMALVTAACGGGQPAAPAATPAAAPATPPAASAPGATAVPATPGVVRIIEPAEGSSSGHISLFRWNAVEGATGYKMHLAAVTDGRTIWDSPVVAEPEAHLPNTVALEPEAYTWTVTAMKGDAVLATSGTNRFLVTP